MLKQGFSHTHCSVFTFTLRTFAVVFASYLKASVCPFSRYTLNILGTHSRRCPWAPQKCYCVPSHLALPNLEPHQVRDSFLAFGNFLKDTLALSRNMHGICSIDWVKARMFPGSAFSTPREFPGSEVLLLENWPSRELSPFGDGRTQLKIASQRERELEFLSTDFL